MITCLFEVDSVVYQNSNFLNEPITGPGGRISARGGRRGRNGPGGRGGFSSGDAIGRGGSFGSLGSRPQSGISFDRQDAPFPMQNDLIFQVNSFIIWLSFSTMLILEQDSEVSFFFIK